MDFPECTKNCSRVLDLESTIAGLLTEAQNCLNTFEQLREMFIDDKTVRGTAVFKASVERIQILKMVNAPGGVQTVWVIEVGSSTPVAYIGGVNPDGSFEAVYCFDAALKFESFAAAKQFKDNMTFFEFLYIREHEIG